MTAAPPDKAGAGVAPVRHPVERPVLPPVLPAVLPFRTTLTVQAGDINAGGHLGHDHAVTLLHELRVRWLAACNASEAGTPAAPGIIVRTLGVHYHAEAFWGEVLDAGLGVLEAGGVRAVLGYRLGRAGTEVVTARTEIAFFDYVRRRPCRPPPALVTAINRYRVPSANPED